MFYYLIRMNSKIENLLKQAAVQADSTANGASSVTSASRVFLTSDEAERAFQIYRKNLFSIENWNKASEISGFVQFDENGKEQMQKPIAVGSMIKISLPGSGKDDWVKVVEIHETSEEFVITLQPWFDPTDAENKIHTSHFFVDTSTNNFCLQRKNKKINFHVIGLGERTNTEDTGGLLETVRNLAASNVGYYLGIQKTQWKTFCEDFLAIEKQ